MEIKLCGNPMFDINIQIDDQGQSLWVAKPRLPARPKELFIIDIVAVDNTRPEGVAPFEVQTMGEVEQLRLINNGDGTYKFQCIPEKDGHLTVQISLHGQPIKDSPVTVKVGDGRTPTKVKQESGPVRVVSDTRPGQGRPQSVQTFSADPVESFEESYGDFGAGGTGGGDGVSNDDLAALLDELGG